jgi:luciferase family oxidoreductase group 1
MLPHYSAFKIAESFRMLDALAPGRIDLGVGRAPGGTSLVSAALESRDPSEFPHQIEDAIAYLDGAPPASSPFATLKAMPSGGTSPEVWVLGSSEYGALLAAKLGLPYAYAHFIGGDASEIPQAYRARFKPSARAAEPRSIIAVAAIAAPTDEEAAELALPLKLWRSRILRGITGPFPSLAEARAHAWTPFERFGGEHERRLVAGAPATVRAKIEELVEANAADEVLVVTIVPDYATRLRSYELLAEAFALTGSLVTEPR